MRKCLVYATRRRLSASLLSTLSIFIIVDLPGSITIRPILFLSDNIVNNNRPRSFESDISKATRTCNNLNL